MFVFYYVFYVVELCRLIFEIVIFNLYVDEIKLFVLNLVLCRVKDNPDFIIRICRGHDFSMVGIAPTVSLVHDAQKLVLIDMFSSFTIKHNKEL
jgi:hypothetical protein